MDIVRREGSTVVFVGSLRRGETKILELCEAMDMVGAMDTDLSVLVGLLKAEEVRLGIISVFSLNVTCLAVMVGCVLIIGATSAVETP